MTTIVKNLLIAVSLVLVAVAGYFMFTQSTATSLSFEADDTVITNMQANSRLFIERRKQLNEIEFETSFFSDPRIINLQSFNAPIVEQPVGRDNPFQLVTPSTTGE